jgi:hypothetical protein
MTQEEQLREQRQALNAALNNHDVQTATSFLHPDFVAHGQGGHSHDRQATVSQLEQFLKPSMNFHSQVEVENVEVSGDSATLRVCRTERLRMDDPLFFWGFLAAAAFAAYMAGKAVHTGVRYESVISDWVFWGGIWVPIVGAAIGFVCFICGAYFLGRRSRHQTQRAQETWRLVDGRWLLAEERQRSCAIKETPKQIIEVAVGAAVALVVGALGSLLVTGYTRSDTEYHPSGVPALKLEVRRASTEKVEGWKPMTTRELDGDKTFHVSPQTELSNEDVISTWVFNPDPRSQDQKHWNGTAVLFLVFAVVDFVLWRRSKYKHWVWGVCAGVFLLLGLGSLPWGFAEPPKDDRGVWQVAMKFNEAGTEKVVALLYAEKPLPKNAKTYLAFLVDGELTFTLPGATVRREVRRANVREGRRVLSEPNREGGYSLYQVGLSKEDATRIAKGIVGP